MDTQEIVLKCGVDHEAAKELILRTLHKGSPATWAKEQGVPFKSVPDRIMFLEHELSKTIPALLRAHPDGEAAARQQQENKPEAHNPVATQFAYLVHVSPTFCPCVRSPEPFHVETDDDATRIAAREGFRFGIS